MATIYRFIVEQRTGGGGDGRYVSDGAPNRKSAAKKGKWVSVLGGARGGVEHNRKMRAVNPLINRATGGVWERGMRFTRASLGVVQRNTETGKLRIGGPALAIIIQMVLLALLKWQMTERKKALQQNQQNYKQLENGIGAVHGEYKISTNIFTGRQTYNQNK